MKHINVAIDGPASSGKSTVANAIASVLGILHLDTGAMYRAMAYKVLQCGCNPANEAEVLPILNATDIRLGYNHGKQQVFVDGVDVMGCIRTSAVSKGASDIAVIPAVRVKLVELQRGIAARESIVLDGRDIGSYVLPNADFKFYLTAEASTRAKRRLLEMQAKGLDNNKTLDEMTDEITLRDYTDMNREFAPLKRADDAFYIDTTDLSIDEVTGCIISQIKGGTC